jgi:hypothetical protein
MICCQSRDKLPENVASMLLLDPLDPDAKVPPGWEETAAAGGPLRPGRAASPGLELSNDYLNHYSEVLMLIELAASEPESLADLGAWRPLDYRTYFAASPLRRAADAIAAYDALPQQRRSAFEALTDAMDKLATSAILALQPPCTADKAALVAEVTLPAFHGLVGRAASFLSSAGQDLDAGGEVEEAQAVIDRLLDPRRHS